MDLDSKIQANAEGFFVVTFFNEQEKSLTEPTVTYIFSKFGQVSEIKYVEHGRVFIFYKEKEEALKALEIMNMGSKYHVEIEWQPVKKNETTENIKKEGEDSFIYLRIPPAAWKGAHWGMTGYVEQQLFGNKDFGQRGHLFFSWLYTGHVKIVFDSKMAKDEIMEKNEKNLLKWPKQVGGNFEFCDDVPFAYIQTPWLHLAFSSVKNALFGNETVAKTKIKSLKVSNCRKIVVVVFDSKITKDEVMEAHNKKPFVWHENMEVLQFLNLSEALSMTKYNERKKIEQTKKN